MYLHRGNDLLSAKKWFEAAALQGDENAAFYALACCDELHNMPETSFWFNIVSKSDMMPDNPDARY